MPVTVPVWVMTGGTRQDITCPEPPACVACATYRMPVRWVITALHNPSGLPGCATVRQAFSCAIHLHQIAARTAEEAVSGVTLTPYGH